MKQGPDDFEKFVRENARRFRYPASPDLRGGWKRDRPANPNVNRIGVAAILIAMLLLFVTLRVPSVRAGILDFIQIGSERIWFGVPKYASHTGESYNVGGQPMSLEAVQRTLGFSIALPSYPNGLGSPDAVYLLSEQEDGVYLIWYAAPDHPEIRIAQFGAGFWVEKWGPGGDVPNTLRVNGNRAVWMVGPHLWSFHSENEEHIVTVPKGVSVLIWSINNVTYRLESSLPQTEAILIAESME